MVKQRLPAAAYQSKEGHNIAKQLTHPSSVRGPLSPNGSTFCLGIVHRIGGRYGAVEYWWEDCMRGESRNILGWSFRHDESVVLGAGPFKSRMMNSQYSDSMWYFCSSLLVQKMGARMRVVESTPKPRSSVFYFCTVPHTPPARRSPGG